VEAGGRTVSMGSLLSEAFRTNPSMWGPDNFHPSVTGYAAASAALLPSVAAAMGIGPESYIYPEPFRGEAVLPIAEAAVQAARTAGTEVAATEVAGHERGPRGRWAELRHRRRHPEVEVERVEAVRVEEAAGGTADAVPVGK
ncbi:MAG: hypothetical protein QOH84_3115, partial [Kribbellaceae bacterium]|nr:hypothetical protein [Kribbellaceae bacterium]